MASSIVKSAAQQLGNLLVEEAKYLYKVRDKIENLQTELEWMECFLRDADTQQHKEKVICKWVSQVRDLAYDAEDIILRYLHEVTHHQRNGIINTIKWFSYIVYTCDAWTLHNLGSEIEDMTVQISNLTSRLQRYGIPIIKPTKSLEYNPMSREERMTYSHTSEDVVGLKKDIQQVVDRVLRADVNVVGISGTGGLGKTTLARKVFLNEQIQNSYTCAWVYISQEFDRTRIFEEILRGLHKDTTQNGDVADLPHKINQLLSNRKCFVVLDDIWTVDAWKRLKVAFESIFKNCESKILITTRKRDLLSHVHPSSGYLHPLQPLSPDDSWELLRRKTSLIHKSEVGELPEKNEPQVDDQVIAASSSTKRGMQKNEDEVTHEELGREMLKHCDGLPLAIIALGGILSTRKTIIEWKNVQQNIASYLMTGGGENEHEIGGILQVLELSYQDLPFYLKPCFLYLGIFPEDYEIPAQRLYHLWQAECLLTVEGEVAKTSSHDVGERYLNELVQRSMVQVEKYREDNGRIESCKLHDIMRDLCLKKGEEINFLNMFECTKWDLQPVLADCCTEESKKLHRIAVHGIDADCGIDESDAIDQNKHDEEKKATCVRSIVVFLEEYQGLQGLYTLPGRAWKSFPLLRVLDLEGVPIKGVLEGVEDLIHLRFLSIRNTYISELPPRFYDLKCVETLDLRCSRMRLPGKQLGKLERLRHLYLPERYEDVAWEKLRLPVSCRMETLVNFDPSRCEIKDLLKMTNLRFFELHPESLFEGKEELKGVLKAQVMKKSGQLLNTTRLSIKGRIIDEEPRILSSLAAPPSSFALSMCSSVLNNDIPRDILFPGSLTGVEIQQYKIEEAHILALGKLPYLKHLNLCACTLGGYRGHNLTFSASSFLQVKYIRLYRLMELEEWEVEDKALPELQRLRVEECPKLKKLPQGLPSSVVIECRYPCIRGHKNYNPCRYFIPDDPESCYNGKYFY